MPRNPDIIIQEILDTIEGAITTFEKAIPELESKMLQEVELLTKQLTVKGGNLEASIGNLKKLAEINRKIQSVVVSPEYRKEVKAFIDSFDKVTALQTEYYSVTLSTFTVPVTIEAIKKLSVEATVTALTESGIDANLTTKLKQIIGDNIKGRRSYFDLRKEVSEFISGSDKIPGRLKSYSGQIATDSINNYSREYDSTVTENLGLKWFKYVGANVTGTRPFCEALRRKKFVHKSELSTIAEGNINGVTVSRAGLRPGTTGETLQRYAGGFRCNHKLIAVSEESVPKKLVKKFKGK